MHGRCYLTLLELLLVRTHVLTKECTEDSLKVARAAGHHQPKHSQIRVGITHVRWELHAVHPAAVG